MGTNISGTVADDKDDNARDTAPWLGAWETTSPLPIELISFSGSNKGNVNVLQWVTASELNNDYFTVEQSADAEKFSAIGTIQGAGNSHTKVEYSLTDEHPYELTYYRLKQTDYDGKFSYSQTIAVKKPDLTITNFYPNPSSGDFNVNVSSVTNTQVKINVVDVLGRELISKYTNTDKGSNLITIDVSGLSKGTYFIQVINSSNMYKAQKQFEVQ